MSVARVGGRPIVQLLSDGSLALWAGDEADPHGLVLDPAPALEAAGEMLRLLRGGSAAPATLSGVVERVSILPPAAPGLSGRLKLEAGGSLVELVIPWSVLSQLSAAAADALAAATPAGEG